MTEFTMTVYATPKPKARAQITNRGNYTPDKAAEYEQLLARHALVAMRAAGLSVMTGPVEMALIFGLPAASRGDLDNYVKAVCDGLNGVVYVDDRQVQKTSAVKLKRKDRPFCRVTVTELPETWAAEYEECI